jgi:hypothetical protein
MCVSTFSPILYIIQVNSGLMTSMKDSFWFATSLLFTIYIIFCFHLVSVQFMWTSCYYRSKHHFVNMWCDLFGMPVGKKYARMITLSLHFLIC